LTVRGQLNGVNGSINYNQVNDFVNENTLTYTKNINENNQLTATGIFSTQSNNTKAYGFTSGKLPNENLGMSGLDQGVVISTNSMLSNFTLASFAGRINYSLFSKYLFTATFRADGSSKFPAGNKWGYFPSGAFAWRFSEEGFMKNIRVISNAKLRACYGVTGNNRVADFGYLSQISTNSNAYYTIGNTLQQAFFVTSLGNDILKWESTGQFDAGLELGFLKDRISVEAGVYLTLSQLSYYGDQYPLIVTNSTDEGLYNLNNTSQQIFYYNETSSDAINSALWSNFYTGIDRANRLLENINVAKDISDVDRKHVMAEALFLRAYFYFMLVQWYGDVPLRLTSTQSAADGPLAFTPAKTIYDTVIAQMTAAEGMLTDQKASSLSYNERITYTAVQGILARVCLYAAGYPINDTRRYADALAWAKKVVASGEHKLNPDYSQIFKLESADGYDNINRESIWRSGSPGTRRPWP